MSSIRPIVDSGLEHSNKKEERKDTSFFNILKYSTKTYDDLSDHFNHQT